MSRLRNPSKHAGAAYQEARPIHVRMDLRSTAPAERGREAAGEASPRRDAWPVAAAPKRRLRLPAQRIARKKKTSRRRNRRNRGDNGGRKGVEGGWGASTTGRERAGCDPTKTKWPPLFFRAGDLGEERRRGGRRGGRRGRADRTAEQPGFGGQPRRVRCPCRVEKRAGCRGGAGFRLLTGPAKPPGSGTGIPVRFGRKPVGVGRI